MARPRVHLVISSALAWWTWRRWGARAGAAALAGGVLLDVDHLVDYVVSGRGRRRTHFVAPLHGWELPAVLALAARLRRCPAQRHAPVTAALALGWWLHLAVDLLTNRPRHAGVYLLLYRLWHRFRRDVTGWDESTRFHGWTGAPWWTWV